MSSWRGGDRRSRGFWRITRCQKWEEGTVFKKISHAATQRRKACRAPSSAPLRLFFASLRLCVSIFLCLLALSACKREQRQFTTPPATFKSYDVTMSEVRSDV